MCRLCWSFRPLSPFGKEHAESAGLWLFFRWYRLRIQWGNGRFLHLEKASPQCLLPRSAVFLRWGKGACECPGRCLLPQSRPRCLKLIGRCLPLQYRFQQYQCQWRLPPVPPNRYYPGGFGRYNRWPYRRCSGFRFPAEQHVGLFRE